MKYGVKKMYSLSARGNVMMLISISQVHLLESRNVMRNFHGNLCVSEQEISSNWLKILHIFGPKCSRARDVS